MLRDRFHERKEARIEKQHDVFCIVEDVGKLLRVQTWVAGVEHRATTRHGEIRLQVPMVVPGERGDARAAMSRRAAQAHVQAAGSALPHRDTYNGEARHASHATRFPFPKTDAPHARAATRSAVVGPSLIQT